ncbi:exo-beta-N-acetylmuramidase NamZ domain-containing protein [Bacillus salitolerans]|uniref:Exo-beta-N-acetylmuramidase NamZ domain-containing protein n=1 Tax=Bacillus salitolerans TaxID=1437434 RepID=A0ABW4LL62_9BACI
MRLGIDLFLTKHYKPFIGKKIGLVTNLTGVNESLVPTIDLFHEHPEIDLVALYGPEHGIRGDANEGEKVESSIDPYTGLPVYSLYGNSKKPSEAMLQHVDVIVFDLQDIGSRYYTFIYTMAYVMEACAEFGKTFVVLDRPNPISGNHVEGNLLKESFRSFVGLYPIPNRHGMTVGELALFFKHEMGINCEVIVVEMEDWSRDMYYDQTGLYWVPPSPNTTGMDMCILYPGTCLVEGTNLSEGRGTTKPFEYIGAPFIDGYKLARRLNTVTINGVIARPTSFKPVYQKYKDQVCAGVQLHVVKRDEVDSLRTGLLLLETIAEMYPNEFEFVQHGDRYFFDLLAGTDELRKDILQGRTDEFLNTCDQDVEFFQKQKKSYLLYR